MHIELGFSPCPNDTFIFDAMVHGRIDTEGLTFSVTMADVEELNRRAMANAPDVTKLSFHAYAHVFEHYVLLNSGCALGSNCGPLLIAAQQFASNQVKHLRIAIPGHYTTANFLMGFAFPEATDRTEMLFSDIEGAIARGEVDAGVIIHENRFTYAERGFHRIIDLGEHWEQRTGHPIPLGGIAVHRRIDPATRLRLDRVLRRSIEHAMAHPEVSLGFTREHAQEMDPEVMRRHIALYVNDFSLNLGEKGRAAVQRMYAEGAKLPGFPKVTGRIFV
ncbi:MAG: 1,4-dihydroxy-6-naphthoate synthase [Flavobacteriales bacterium]|nr:1,4-dihydroxy-6-naphthoate synthase [Flavobacteriales bacterium]